MTIVTARIRREQRVTTPLLTAMVNNSRQLITQALPERSCGLKEDVFAGEGFNHDFSLYGPVKSTYVFFRHIKILSNIPESSFVEYAPKREVDVHTR